jgi:serine O-acetyltransferase
MSLVAKLIYARRHRLFKRVVQEVLALYGVEVPAAAEIGPGLVVFHRGFGLVLHPRTTLGADVVLYNNVTIGRADPWVPQELSRMERVVVEDGAVLCTGARVICKEGVLTVGRGTIVGANAVLNRSTGPNEIWAGVPARRVGFRQPPVAPADAERRRSDAGAQASSARSTERASSVAAASESG